MNSMFVPARDDRCLQDERLFTKIDAVEQRGTPVRHVHCVKTRLEQLVFEQDPYPSGERLIGLVERLTKPVCRARISSWPG